jgi:hypothetical protein
MRGCQVWQTKENYKYLNKLTTRIQHCKNTQQGKYRDVFTSSLHFKAYGLLWIKIKKVRMSIENSFVLRTISGTKIVYFLERH